MHDYQIYRLSINKYSKKSLYVKNKYVYLCTPIRKRRGF